MTLAVMSCSKVELSSPPVIANVYTPNEHGVGYQAQAGIVNRFYVTLSDDESLKESKVSMSRTEDFHFHSIHGGELHPAFKSPNIGEWNPESVLPLQGIDTTVIFKFSAPANISGVWNLNISVLDADGNLSNRQETLVIQNDSIPAIVPVATSHSSNDKGFIEMSTGELFTIQGNILDANFLQKIDAVLFLNDEVHWQQTWMPENIWMFEMAQIQVPQFLIAGNYVLRISATDRNGWQNWMQADFTVN